MFYSNKTHPNAARLFGAIEDYCDKVTTHLEALTDEQIEAVNAVKTRKLQKLKKGELSYRLTVPLRKPGCVDGRKEITMEKNAGKWTLTVVDVRKDFITKKEYPRVRMVASTAKGHFSMTQKTESHDYRCDSMAINGTDPGFMISSRAGILGTDKVIVDRISDVDVLIADFSRHLNRFADCVGMNVRLDLPDVKRTFAVKTPNVVPNPSGR